MGNLLFVGIVKMDLINIKHIAQIAELKLVIFILVFNLLVGVVLVKLLVFVEFLGFLGSDKVVFGAFEGLFLDTADGGVVVVNQGNVRAVFKGLLLETVDCLVVVVGDCLWED